jgi:hypothetical protein
MQFDRKMLLAVLVLMLALPGASGSIANSQDKQSRLAFSNGKGTLKVGAETFNISSAIVKLIDDRTAEVTLVSDITVFLGATWSSSGESQREFDLQITGGASGGGLDGTGKVVLGSDGKSIVRLQIKGVSRTTKRPFEADFEGK